MAGRGIRLVHVSSLAAIGPSDGALRLGEDAEPHPLTHYGRSKLEAERVVRRLAPEAVIVRPPVVYGPRDTDVFQLLKSISKGLVLELAGGERWFSAIYVKDLVAGLMAALRSPRAAGRSYFLAHAKPVSWTQLGESAARIMARTPARRHRAVAAGARGGNPGGNVGAGHREAGDRLARENRRSKGRGVGLRYLAGGGGTGIPGPHRAGSRPGGDARLV